MQYAIRQFPLDASLESNLQAMLGKPEWAGWTVNSSFGPVVTGGNYVVFFVLQRP